jgi:hypothetical protein
MGIDMKHCLSETDEKTEVFVEKFVFVRVHNKTVYALV